MSNERQIKPLQLEIREYGGVSRDLIEIAKSGIVLVLQEMQVPQTKPLRLHVTEGGFQTLKGAIFVEVYLPRQDLLERLQTKPTYKDILYESFGPSTDQVYLQDPIEQEAHRIGSSAAKKIPIVTQSAPYQATIREVKPFINYPISFNRYIENDSTNKLTNEISGI